MVPAGMVPAGMVNDTAAQVRVLRIIDRLNIGGPAKHVTWLSAGLDQGIFDTLLITGTVAPHEGDMTDFARGAGVDPWIIKEMGRELGWRDGMVILKLLRFLWQYKPDIVHTHKAKAGAVGRVAAWLYKWLTPSLFWLRPRPLIVIHTYHGHIFHSYYSPMKTQLFLFIERFLAWLVTDRIIVISLQQRREIHERFGIGRTAQFTVIPLGISCDEGEGVMPKPSLRNEAGLAPGESVIGIVGRLCPVKNHALLLQAFARLQCESTDEQGLRLVVIGDGELREELERLAQQLQIAARVIFTGFRSDTAALYRELDLVALTSLNEGTPLTLIEAMNQGRAVVATEVGGVVDILGQRQGNRDGLTIWEHGVTVLSGDEKAFVRALRYLLERPQLRQEMGQRGQAFVRARLSRERLLHDISTLYQSLIHHPLPQSQEEVAACYAKQHES
jgi:glycosyltransferase involved in cell wall biosynthesis